MTNRPTHTAYSVKDGPGTPSNGKWTEIGTAWTTKDEKGLILHLHCLPIDGRIVLRQTERGQA